MVIADAIRAARVQRDTEIPDELFVKWLSSLDGQIWEDVIKNYEDPGVRPNYGEDADLEGTELQIPAPWDEMYVNYLVMKIDLQHGDYDRYNNEAILFETERRAWADWYNRTHRWASTDQFKHPRPKYYDTQILF